MLRALAGQPARGVDARDHRETEGNPFFVEEVYLHLVESGVLLDEHGRLRVTFGWMRCRCRRASAWCGAAAGPPGLVHHEVLVAAAVSGRVFTSEIVGGGRHE